MSNSDYTPVNPLGIFPNWIFCPKIVPLVYDDSLSYYEFLNKLMVKLNEVITFANQINANVDYLRTIVERIQELVDDFDERITANEQDIATLKTAMETVNTVIEGINSTLTDMQGDIDSNAAAIENLAQDVEREINTAIGPLQSTVENLSIATANNTARIINLEGAAFGNLELSPLPYTFVMDGRDANSKGWYIVQDEATLSSDSIQWKDGGGYRPTNINEKYKLTGDYKIITFKTTGNACHLVIPSIFPFFYGNNNLDETLYFYVHRWIGNTNANSGYAYTSNGISMRALLNPGGVQTPPPTVSTAWPFGDMEIFPNQSTGCYDLHLYNGRNSYVGCDGVLYIIVSTIKATTEQQFFDLKNTAYNQMAAGLNPDGKIASAKSEMESYTRVYASTQDLIVKQECLLADILNYDLNLDPATGVSVTRENTKYTNYEFDSETRHYKVTKMDVSMVLSLTGLTSGTDFTIGSLQNNYLPIAAMSGNHYLSLDIMGKAGNGYCTILNDGTLAVNITADVSTPTTVRIYGYFVDYIKSNLT